MLENVLVTDSFDGLASTISSRGIVPSTKISTDGSLWNTFWRYDSDTGTDYVFVYNDAINAKPGDGASSGIVEFQSTGIPYEYDAWTGDRQPILTYNQSETSTTIAIQLAGNQSTIIAFHTSSPNSTAPLPITHLSTTSAGILSVLPFTSPNHTSSEILTVKSGPTTSNGTAQNHAITTSSNLGIQIPACPYPSFSLQNWTLIAEHWTPPPNLSSIASGGATVKFNTTHVLPGSTLPSWRDISGLGPEVSGRGSYHTTFAWPPALPSSTSNVSTAELGGLVIFFPPIIHTLRVSVNNQLLPPLDPTLPQVDVPASLLRPGDNANTLVAVVATPLGNVLRTIWSRLMTSGTGPGTSGLPPVKDYGILGEVTGTPYSMVEVDLGGQ